jgi:hypothetical protein
MTMMKKTPLTAIFGVALALLASAETAGAALEVGHKFPAREFGAQEMPRGEISQATGGALSVRARARTADAPSADPPFTCVQLQVIDEIDFLDGDAGANDCDPNAD